uniref:Uncharacterized protein n=1 Tax=Paenibacillus polymyxa TaxID=1406 RepID=A0AAE9IE29_PAEPO
MRRRIWILGCERLFHFRRWQKDSLLQRFLGGAVHTTRFCTRNWIGWDKRILMYEGNSGK